MTMLETVEMVMGPPAKGKPGSKWAKWPCPEHPDTDPSFGVAEGFAYCFSCHETWSEYWFLVTVGKYRPGEAHAYLNGNLNYAVPHKRRTGPTLEVPRSPSLEWVTHFTNVLQQGTEALASDVGGPGRMELKKRGISVKVWQHYRIGWNDQRSSDPLFLPGLMLPAFVDGKLWQLVIRPECGRPKYLFVEGGTAVPFGLDVRQGCSDLVICEGELDALLVATVLWGKADIIALCGTAKNIRMWLDYLWHYKQVFLCLDGDRGGQEAAARIMGIRPTWQNRVPPKDHDDMCKLHYAQFDLFKFIYMNRLERSKKQWTL